MKNWHFGRQWSGHEIEDGCPCPKAKCGLISEALPDCQEHGLEFSKTFRQGHLSENCPASYPSHNHVTRDIKKYGECPACDRYLARDIG